MRRWWLLLLVLLVLPVTGCGTQSVPDNAAWRGEPEVSGTVSLDGIPLRYATIAFHRPEGSSHTALTDVTGKYSLDLNDAGREAIGKYAVRIQIPPASTGEDGASEGQRVPARYNDNTELVVDILDGPITLNFDLRGENSDSE